LEEREAVSEGLELVTLNATIRADQMRRLDRYVKDRRKVSRSEAVREVLDTVLEALPGDAAEGDAAEGAAA
jgi:metal-responsive CopG/Arc/MetJ family transcriptional regulator